jgi:hypothetical protein
VHVAKRLVITSFLFVFQALAKHLEHPGAASVTAQVTHVCHSSRSQKGSTCPCDKIINLLHLLEQNCSLKPLIGNIIKKKNNVAQLTHH